MNYTVETIRKAMKLYQEKHGGTLPEVSILFVNVMEAFDEAAQQSVERTAEDVCPRGGNHDWITVVLVPLTKRCQKCGGTSR